MTINLGTFSDNVVVLDNANINLGTFSGNAIINMKASVNQGTFSGNAVMTGSTSLTSGTISGNGILAGKGTSCNSCTIQGRVFNGVSCKHSVGANKLHFDKRSCNDDDPKDTLIDEREGCTSPGAKDCGKDQKTKPTIC